MGMWFWIAAAAMVAGSLLGPFLVLRSAGRGTPSASRAQALAVYRDQLDEVARDAARGTIGAAEADALRGEIGRRMLEADRAGRGAEAAVQPGAVGGGPVFAAALAGLAALVAVGAYLELGRPDLSDQPLDARQAAAQAWLDARPAQADAEAAARAGGLWPAPAEPDPEFVRLAGEVRAAVAGRPDDIEGHRMLAWTEARLGEFTAARRAQERVVELGGAAAATGDLEVLAGIMIEGAAGAVSPEAEAVLLRVLERDGANGPALFHLGRLYDMAGRPDRAFALWDRLLRQAPAGDPWADAARQGMGALAWRAGQHRYEVPAAAPAPGPDAGDIAAAEAMSPEERAEMIRSMVAGLAERLATEGGPAADWARLIQAYGVLGEAEAARAIHAEALERFAGSAGDLALIAEAAAAAGIAP
jgi:cytochrome c-type biogenesis protein CcmH